jgi:hypothetical protein
MRKGGSISSDSVTSLVNSNTYKQMNNAASNKVSSCAGGKNKRGGSVASNSVVTLVNSNTYKQMDNAATNKLSSCGGSIKCRIHNVKHRNGCPSIKRGGNDSLLLSKAINSLKETYEASNSVSKSMPANAFNYESLKGGLIAKNLSELNSSNAYSIRNSKNGGKCKRGGDLNENTVKIGLTYDVVPSTTKQYGDYVDRETPSAVLHYISEQTPITSMAMNKTVSAAFGSVTDQISPFNYAHGGKKKTYRKKKN